MDLVAKLVAIGIDDKKAQEVAKNAKLSTTLTAMLMEANVPPCDPAAGKLIYLAATKFPPDVLAHRPLLLRYQAALARLLFARFGCSCRGLFLYLIIYSNTRNNLSS